MKKNLILAVSLFLSLAATLNLTSCENDWDDDGTITPEEEQVDKSSAVTIQYKTGLVGISYGEDVPVDKQDSLKAVLFNNIQSYLKDNIGGLAEDVVVSKDNKHILIYADSKNSAEIADKLEAMNEDKLDLKIQIEKNIPEVVGVLFSIHQADNLNSVFTLLFVK